MKQVRPAITLLIIFTAILGFVYPLAVTGIAQTAFNKQADGSLIEINGVVVGSELIGQLFANERYFHSRPSVANYDAANSGGGNQGPLNESLKNAIKERIAVLHTKTIPSDLVTASASGLDPHISVESAMIQVSRVAKARGVNENAVKAVVEQQIERFPFSDPIVNVLKLNLALDNTH
jgi:potassium-transporting ATPase KdpC subunit